MIKKLIIIVLLSSCTTDKSPITQHVKTVGDLSYYDLRDGLGLKVVENGDLITVDYAGWIITDSMNTDMYSEWIFLQKFRNQLFQSSYQTKKPHQFTVGEGTVIKGWDIGLIGMKETAKRILKIPSSLAYGSRGFGEVIKGNVDLRFEVEVLKIDRPEPALTISESIGNGQKIDENSIVKFHFRLNRIDDGTILQNSFGANKPARIKMNDSGLPRFMQYGLIGLANNGERIIRIPAFPARNLKEMEAQFKILKVIQPVYPWQIDQSKTKISKSGLKYNILREGVGSILKSGDSVSIHYSVYSINGDKIFSTIEIDRPTKIVVDAGNTAKGLSEGLKLLKLNSKARLILSPELTRSPNGSDQNLPKNIKLVFDLEVLE